MLGSFGLFKVEPDGQWPRSGTPELPRRLSVDLTSPVKRFLGEILHSFLFFVELIGIFPETAVALKL